MFGLRATHQTRGSLVTQRHLPSYVVFNRYLNY